MARPTIVYNASTGSDTAASGAGPATAVTGTNAEGVALDTTLTLNETVDFTGVADDAGSDALWCETNAGERHLFSIASFTGGAATCTAIVTNTAFDADFAAKSWAVGGKRQTLDSESTNNDWEDMLAGWTFEFEAGTYDVSEAIDNPVGGTITDGPVTFQAATGAAPVIRSHAAGHMWTFQIDVPMVYLLGLTLTTLHTLQLFGGGIRFSAAERGQGCVVRDCICEGGLGYGIYADGGCYWTAVDCIFRNMARQPFYWSGGYGGSLRRCRFQGSDNGFAGVNGASGAQGGPIFIECIFSGCDTYGAEVTATNATVQQFYNCTFYNNTLDGLRILGHSGSQPEKASVTVENCIFVSNGGYGINYTYSDNASLFIGPNAYYNNTSGQRNNIPAHSDDVTMTADPFSDAAGDDFSLNTAAGGGALIDTEGAGLTS